jgi:hypothetical protein
MLSSLGRNGFHHKSVMVRHSQLVSYALSFRRYHQFSRHRHHARILGTTLISRTSTSTTNVLHLYRRTTTHSRTFFLPARSFSTPPTTTSKSKDVSSPPTIAPPPVKPKVELRPGPIKSPITHLNPHSQKAKKLPQTNPPPQAQSTLSTAIPSNPIVAVIKEDLKQAYIHGVLAPPLPNAGRIATLWHQVKELFVR